MWRLALGGRHHDQGVHRRGQSVDGHRLGEVDGGINLACLDGEPWAAVGTAIQHLDPQTREVLASVTLTNAYYVGVGAGSVWSSSGDDVIRIDPTTAEIIATIPTGEGYDVTEVDGSNDDAIWVTVKEANKVYRIDPATNEVIAEIDAGQFAHEILVQPDAVWISNAHEDSVTRIDPANNQATTIAGPGAGVGLAEGAGDVWSSSREGDLYRIDPSDSKATMVGHLDGWPYGIAFADDVLWWSMAAPRSTASRSRRSSRRAEIRVSTECVRFPERAENCQPFRFAQYPGERRVLP